MNQSGKTVFLVIDTNIYIDDLDLSKALFQAAVDSNFSVAVPCRVRSEILGISLSGGKSLTVETMQASANALEFLEIEAKSYRSAVFQEPEEMLLPGLRGDDDILDYCRWLMLNKSAAVFLLTKDRQLNRRAPSMLIVPLREHSRALKTESLISCVKTFNYRDWVENNRFYQDGPIIPDTPETHRIVKDDGISSKPTKVFLPVVSLRIQRRTAQKRKFVRHYKIRHPSLANYQLIAICVHANARKRRGRKDLELQCLRPLRDRPPAGVTKSLEKHRFRLIDLKWRWE